MNAGVHRSLVARAERVTGMAWTDLVDAVPPATRSRLGLEHRVIGGTSTLVAAAGIDHMLFNRTLLTSPSHVAQAAAVYERAGVGRCLLSITAEQFPAALAAGRPLGLERFRRPWGTLVRTSGSVVARMAPPSDVTLRPARRADADRIGAIVCPAFDLPESSAAIFAAVIERPRWEVFVAECGGRVAAVGLLFVDGGAAVLVAGATAPDHRRRGLQGLLVAHRVAVAHDRGASLVCSETGVAVEGDPNSSWDNLVHAGLRPVGISEHLCRRGASWSDARGPA